MPALSERAFSSAARCWSVGACGLSGLVKGRKVCRIVSMVAMSRPNSRLPCKVTIENPPGTFTGLEIAPTGISVTRRETAGSSWFTWTHPSSPPSSAVWLWLNWAATTGKGAPARSSVITVSAKRCASAVFCGSSTGMKISPTRYSGLPTCCSMMRCWAATSASVMVPRSASWSRITWVQPSWVRTWSISVRMETPSEESLARSAS